MHEGPLQVWLEENDALLRLRLSRPKANIIDAEMIAALGAALAEHRDSRILQAALLDAEGPHFSFGASVEEHLPEQCAGMLAAFHDLICTMLEFPLPILVAIRGQCLGGGLELASACSQLFASPDAQFGQPEIQLGVFAPAASCLLPERIGHARAEDLLFSGRSVSSGEAQAMGLLKELAAEPEDAALHYFEQYLGRRSPSSLRCAVEAARADLVVRVKTKMQSVERLYLDGLMRTHDAVEGLNAFLEKRPPQWERPTP